MSATSTSGKTGETCLTTGEYYCEQHTGNTIPLERGETFPPCSTGGGHGTTWILL